MNTRTRVFFYHQLSVMLKAGLPVLGALEDMAKRGQAAARHAAGSLLRGVSRGETLAEQMARFPDQFSPLEVTAVKAGEVSGRLPETLARLAQHYEVTGRAGRRLITGMIYPLLLVHLAAIIPAAPQLFMDNGGMSAFLHKALPLLLLLYALGALAVFMNTITKHPSALAPVRDRILHLVPIFGPLIRAGPRCGSCAPSSVFTKRG